MIDNENDNVIHFPNYYPPEYAVYRGDTPNINAEKCLQDYLSKVSRDLICFFSDQVTCICTKTKMPLFDEKKAQFILDRFSEWSEYVVETLKDEMEEYS